MEKEVRQRLQWVKLYEESGDAGFVCRRCGISRPTLRKWWKRYQAQGIDGLKSQSRRPHTSPAAKIGPDHEKLILELRGKRNLGARRIQSELKRLHGISLSVASIHKVLCRHLSPDCAPVNANDSTGPPFGVIVRILDISHGLPA